MIEDAEWVKLFCNAEVVCPKVKIFAWKNCKNREKSPT
jgi:hypothetical protein